MNYYCVPLSNKVPLFVGFERHSASNPALGRLQDRQKQCENGQAGRRLSVAAVMHWIPAICRKKQVSTSLHEHTSISFITRQ